MLSIGFFVHFHEAMTSLFDRVQESYKLTSKNNMVLADGSVGYTFLSPLTINTEPYMELQL